METVPVCDLKVQFRSLETELRGAMDRVLRSAWFILGREVSAFEEEFARWTGAAHCVGVGSGTDAIHLALRAVGLKPGDGVLTAVNSATPTACAILEAGARPVFADVDPESGLMDPKSAEREITRAGREGKAPIRAILPVHLYGRCAPMDAILELAGLHGLAVVEDAAQAHGAQWSGQHAGTLGSIGCFSFYPSKNLGAMGDGGACVTNDPDLALRLRRLRNYGEKDRYESVEIGFNSRLDELQAAVLRVKLEHLSEWNARRERLAAEYRRRLSGLPLRLPPETPPGDRSVHHLFVVQAARRDRLRRELMERGVGTQIHYPVPIHLQPAYAGFAGGPGSFPAAEARAGRILTLPMFPELTDSQMERIENALRISLAGEAFPEEISC